MTQGQILNLHITLSPHTLGSHTYLTLTNTVGGTMYHNNHDIDRRTAIKLSAAAFGVTGTGLGAVALTTDDAQAAVSPSFDVPDASLIDEDGAPSGIFVFARGNWSYHVNEDTGEYALALYTLDTSDGFHLLDVVETLTTKREDAGTFALGGDLLSTDAWDVADFTAPGPGKSITRNVRVGVLLRVLRPDGGLITDGRSLATVGITVTGAELTASIGGTGEVVFQESDGDPTPTSTL